MHCQAELSCLERGLDPQSSCAMPQRLHASPSIGFLHRVSHPRGGSVTSRSCVSERHVALSGGDSGQRPAAPGLAVVVSACV
eukprot:2969097-Rhodomonas_salina.1